MEIVVNRLALTAAAVLLGTFGANAASAATIVSENFNSGLGAFSVTSGAPIAIITGAPGYVACCGATGNSANLTNPFVAFGAGSVPDSGFLSTTFNTVLGATYNLSFKFAVLGGGSSSINYSVVGLSGTASGNANNNFDTTFQTVALSFTGTGSPTTLSFGSTGANSGVDTGIDDVMVTGPVPEPATWAMMLTGFGMIGFAARRRLSVKTTVRFA